MRVLTVVLTLLVLLCSTGFGLPRAESPRPLRLRALVEKEQTVNTELQARNAALEQQVIDLQTGEKVLEILAREDLGLIKNDEVYYQFPDPDSGERAER